MLFFKKKRVPETNDKKTIDAVQLWSVRWGLDSFYRRVEANVNAEFFTSKKDAEDLAISLKNAVKLLNFQGNYFINMKSEE